MSSLSLDTRNIPPDATSQVPIAPSLSHSFRSHPPLHIRHVSINDVERRVSRCYTIPVQICILRDRLIRVSVCCLADSA